MRRQRTIEEAGGLPRCLYSLGCLEEAFSETRPCQQYGYGVRSLGQQHTRYYAYTTHTLG